MEWETFEILEQKIDRIKDKIDSLSEENETLKKKIFEKDQLVQTAQSRLDSLEEEKEVIKGKVDTILKKIDLVLS
jgi:FtsZ-binding cell division protein ZapB